MSVIPKRIIQTGRSLEELSDKERGWRAATLASNPDFEFVFFDDEAVQDFMAREWPEFVEKQGRFEARIQRFDLFRYLAVFRMGGFYFDLDVEITSPLTPLLGDTAVFPFEKLTVFPWLRQRGMTWQLGNYAFGAPAGHPFLEAVINHIRRWLDDPRPEGIPWWYPKQLRQLLRVYYSTGPGAVSRTYLAEPELRSGVTVLAVDSVRHEQRFGGFGVHWCHGSWKNETRTFTRRWLGSRNGRAHRANENRSPGSLVAELGGVSR